MGVRRIPRRVGMLASDFIQCQYLTKESLMPCHIPVISALAGCVHDCRCKLIIIESRSISTIEWHSFDVFTFLCHAILIHTVLNIVLVQFIIQMARNRFHENRMNCFHENNQCRGVNSVKTRWWILMKTRRFHENILISSLPHKQTSLQLSGLVFVQS